MKSNYMDKLEKEYTKMYSEFTPEISARYEKDIRKAEDVLHGVSAMGDFVNAMARDTGDMAMLLNEGVHSLHRTLQQQVVAEMIQFLINYADTPYFDLRNREAVSLCQVIKASLEEKTYNGKISLPHI